LLGNLSSSICAEYAVDESLTIKPRLRAAYFLLGKKMIEYAPKRARSNSSF
jgi:hypothetical protein